MTTTSRGATLLIGSPSGLRKPGEQVLDGKVGHIPQLDVRAGAVTHRREPPAFDPVAPQFRVAQAGLLDPGRDAAHRGTQDSDVGAGGWWGGAGGGGGGPRGGGGGGRGGGGGGPRPPPPGGDGGGGPGKGPQPPPPGGGGWARR